MDQVLHHLVERIGPRLVIVIGQSWCSSKSALVSFLHRYYEWPKWCYFILNVANDLSISTMAYLMAPLHSLVDGLRIKNRCHQKEGDALRPRYLNLLYVCSWLGGYMPITYNTSLHITTTLNFFTVGLNMELAHPICKCDSHGLSFQVLEFKVRCKSYKNSR